MDRDIIYLQKLLDSSRYTVAVTGAGISVSAGIKAFSGMDFPTVMQMASVTVLKNMPEHYYKMAWKAFLGPMFENGPTAAHQKLAELERKGRLQGIITTNIDCLHLLAGSENVAEIQGSFAVNKCLKCGKQVLDVGIWNRGKCPRCKCCGSVMGAFPIYQHIGLLDSEVRKARRWVSQAELVLIIGTEGSYVGVYYSQTAVADRACCLRHRHSELRCWKYSIFSCHSRFNRVCGSPQYNGVSEYSIAVAATCFALFVPSGCGYDSHGGKPENTARIDTPAERGNNK